MASNNKISIYVLRKNLDQFPKRDSCSLGDTVILPSGDMLVWTNLNWFLLPSRFITVDELKEFIRYISSGWPETSELFLEDLAPLISNKDFLAKASEVCSLIRQTDQIAETV